MKKLFLLAVAGVGYVLGARAGRERYEQMRGTFNKVKNDPRVQEKTQQVVDTAKEQAPVVKDKLAGAATTAASSASSVASSAASKVKGSDDGDGLEDKLNPDSTALQDDPYPKGDLP